MFNRMTQPDNEKLETVIKDVLEVMPTYDVDSEEYAKCLNRLERLYELRDNKFKSRVSPDTMAVVAGNLLGIVLIVSHERAHMVTSKALDFVKKSVR